MRILIADDHPLYLVAVRDQVERLYSDAQMVVAGGLAEVLAQLAGPDTLDLLLIDYSMPGMLGPASVQEVVAAAGSAPVVVMSGVAHPDQVRACIGLGAKGFLPKTLDPKVFASAMNIILAGGSYLPVEVLCEPTAAVAPAVTAAPPPAAGGAEFTERERVIIGMMVDGASNKEIARRLDLREVTVKVQMTRIYRKLGAKNRAQAAMLVAQGSILI
jgi:DNA-binding NarL/FixJ family response regulator